MTPIRHTTVALAALLAALPATTLAQSWPERPVRLVIPFPPGGTLDKVGRMLAQELGKSLGQTFIVENKPGGNGVIGGDSVAKAPADGYTLLFNASTFVTAPMTMKSVPYKVQADFVPISLVAQAPLSIAIGNKLGVQDVKGLVAAAKAKAGAHSPYQLAHSKPGSVSEAVGTSGRLGSRLAAVTATTCSCLPRWNCTEPSTGSMNPSICPPIRSWNAGAVPLYGTMPTLMPAACSRRTVHR